MAALKSFCASLAKSASLIEAAVSAYRTRLAPRVLARGLGIALLAGLVIPIAQFAAQAQTPAAPRSTESQPHPESAAKAQALVRQGDEALLKKDFSAAEAAFRAAIDADPLSASAHRELGVALWEQGNPSSAWNELRAASRLDPGDASVHYVLGKLAWLLYQKPPSMPGAGPSLSPDDFRSLALSELGKAVALAPGNFKMRLDLAELTLATGSQKQAQAQAAKAIQIAKSPAERSLAHVTMARAMVAIGDQESAQAQYQMALTENPTNASANLNLGELRLLQQKPREAAMYFRRAIAASPDLEPAYVELAELVSRSGQHAEAQSLLEKALKLDPTDWHARYRLALLLLKAGQSGRAKQMLAGIVAQQPDFLPGAEQLALLLLRQGDLAGAQAQAQDMIARSPQAAEGHRVMALVLWRERKMESSLAECALALGAEPQSASMLALQAIEFWQEREKKNAQAAFRSAARLNPGVADDAAFCGLIACDGRDIPLIDQFLRKNRWVLNPPDAP